MEWIDSTLQVIKDVNWAISLIAAIPLAIVANLLTPKVADRLARRSKEKTDKRIDEIEKELNRVKEIASDKYKLAVETAIVLFKVLIFIALGGAIGAIGMFAFPVAAVLYLSAFTYASRHIKMLVLCQNIAEYENERMKEIETLRTKSSNN